MREKTEILMIELANSGSLNNGWYFFFSIVPVLNRLDEAIISATCCSSCDKINTNHCKNAELGL